MKKILLLSILVFSNCQVFAVETLTWKKCVLETLQNNPVLLAAKENLKKAQSRKSASYAPFYPELEAQLRPRSTSNRNFEDVTDYIASLNLRQNLFAGFSDTAKVKIARAEVNAAVASLVDVKAQVSFDLASAFAQMHFAQELLALSQRIEKRFEENFKLTQSRFENGHEDKGSFLLTKADYQKAQFEVRSAKRLLRVSKRQLLTVMGRKEIEDAFFNFRVEGNIDYKKIEKKPDFNQITQNTPTYLLAVASHQAARAGITLAHSQFYPTVDALATAAIEEGDSIFGAGIAVTLPIFQGGKRFYDVRTARANLRQQEHVLKTASDRSALFLEQTFSNLQNAIDRKAIQVDVLEAASLRAEVERAKYKNGLISFFDWNEVENQFIQEERNKIAIDRDTIIALMTWYRVQGKGYLP